MLVSIAILTNNREKYVLEAIRSAKNQKVSCEIKIEIVVLDNASSDNTRARIREHYPDVKLLATHKNLGCPGGRNILYANCAGDVIVNLDDDGQLDEGVVQGACNIFLSDQSIWVVGFRQVDNSLPKVQRDKKIIEVSTFSGGLSAFKRIIFDRVGFYPDDYFLLAEEEHMALRIIDVGGTIVYCPHLVMFHPPGQSTDSRWDYLRCRNALFNIVELYPFALCIIYFLLRAGSYLFKSIPRGSFFKCLSAVFVALSSFGIRSKKPVSVKTIKKYKKLNRKPLF